MFLSVIMENSEVMETNGLNIAAPNVVAVSTDMASDANVEMNACEGNNDLSANNLSAMMFLVMVCLVQVLPS